MATMSAVAGFAPSPSSPRAFHRRAGRRPNLPHAAAAASREPPSSPPMARATDPEKSNNVVGRESSAATLAVEEVRAWCPDRRRRSRHERRRRVPPRRRRPPARCHGRPNAPARGDAMEARRVRPEHAPFTRDLARVALLLDRQGGAARVREAGANPRSLPPVATRREVERGGSVGRGVDRRVRRARDGGAVSLLRRGGDPHSLAVRSFRRRDGGVRLPGRRARGTERGGRTPGGRWDDVEDQVSFGAGRFRSGRPRHGLAFSTRR